jgi:hypothetical protein
VPSAFPQRETVSHPGSVRQFDFKNVREHSLCQAYNDPKISDKI